MNVGSLSLMKYVLMKASLFLKVFMVLPLILFADYILMAVIGCTSCLFGLGDKFYCGPFCLAGKIILGISALLFGYLIYPEIRHLFLMKNINHSNWSRPGRGLAPGGKRFVDSDKDGVCDLYDTSLKKINFET